MRNPHLGSVRDADGVRILYTWDDDGGAGYNARVTFTATDAGTYYLVAGNSYVYTGGGEYDSKGTYTLSVTEVPDDLAPAFAEGSYAFSLAENADGGAASVALGAVSATDPGKLDDYLQHRGGRLRWPVRDRRGERGGVLHRRG